jgi:hypothetical protein
MLGSYGEEAREPKDIQVKTICRIACATAAAGIWLCVSGCTMTLQQSARPMTGNSLSTTSERENQPSTGSIGLLSPYDNAYQTDANYRAQCGEQARLRNHEVESCRAVRLINLTF